MNLAMYLNKLEKERGIGGDEETEAVTGERRVLSSYVRKWLSLAPSKYRENVCFVGTYRALN